MWTTKTKTTGTSTVKVKIPTGGERSRLLTPNFLQILVGASENEVLIFQTKYTLWSGSTTKQASSWTNKTKV